MKLFVYFLLFISRVVLIQFTVRGRNSSVVSPVYRFLALFFFQLSTPHRYRHQLWQSIFKLPLFLSSFSTPPPALHKFTPIIPATDQLVIDRVNSKSFITALSQEERDGLEKKVRQVLKKRKGLRWLDEEKGIFG